VIAAENHFLPDLLLPGRDLVGGRVGGPGIRLLCPTVVVDIDADVIDKLHRPATPFPGEAEVAEAGFQQNFKFSAPGRRASP